MKTVNILIKFRYLRKVLIKIIYKLKKKYINIKVRFQNTFNNN